jgi:heat shock protein HslJ
LVGLSTAGAQVLAARGERRAGDPPDHFYDPGTRTWTPVAEDPLGPGFDRIYVDTPAGLVLTAKELVPNPGVEPTFVRAAVLDLTAQRWSRLPDSEQVGGWRWTWTGRRMVDATLGEVDGGEVNNYGRSYPIGGVLDPFTGEWGPLPNAPASPSGNYPGLEPGGWPVDAFGGRFTAAEGRLYDDRAETWTVLPRPDGGPTVPGSAVWAGERLVVLGGVDYDGEPNGVLSDTAWLYTPAQVDDPGMTTPAAERDIVGDWEFIDGTSGGTPIPLPDQGRATLSADGQRLTGTAFCNGYGGRYRLDGDRLHAEEVAQTEMACLEPLRMEAESAFLSVLRAGPLQVTRTAEELLLENDEGSLRFRPQTPVPTADLVGTRWTLETLVDGEVASSTVGEPAVLALADDGTFSASTGCRAISGTWRSSGDTVYLDYGWPEGACPPDVEAQEQHVIAALGSGFRAVVEGQQLTVTGRDGQGLVYRAG